MNKAVISLCTLSLLTACAGPAIKDTALIQQTAIDQAQTETKDPEQVIETSRELQISAQQEDLYFYSPNYMAQGEKEIAKAEEALKQNKPASTIITHSLTAKALFERGLATKETVINQLKLSFDGLSMLKEINSHVLLKDDFNDIEDDIKDLIVLIEQNKTDQALKDQKDVLTDITELEVDTLLAKHFAPAEAALEKAEDVDAEEFATKTFEIAEQAVEKLETLIETRYKEREIISDSSKATIRLAQHAENVAKAAQPLLKMNSEQAEEHVLYVESLLDRVTQALDHSSITHLPLNNQSIALAQAVETLSKQAQTIQKNNQWVEEKQTLEATIAELKKASENNIQHADSPSDITMESAQDNNNALESLNAKSDTTVKTNTEADLNQTDTTAVDSNNPVADKVDGTIALETTQNKNSEVNEQVLADTEASTVETATTNSTMSETPNTDNPETSNTQSTDIKAPAAQNTATQP